MHALEVFTHALEVFTHAYTSAQMHNCTCFTLPMLPKS